MNFKCSVCGKYAFKASDGTYVHSCEHTTAPIVANVEATCHGSGGIES